MAESIVSVNDRKKLRYRSLPLPDVKGRIYAHLITDEQKNPLTNGVYRFIMIGQENRDGSEAD